MARSNSVAPPALSNEMRTTGPILRHVCAIVLLVLAWTRLKLWYEFYHPIEYWLFVLCFTAAIVIGVLPQIRYVIKGSSSGRIAVAAGLLVIALPWGEWLRLALPMARENWSHQLLLQFIFVYGAFLLLHSIPRLRLRVKDHTLRMLDHVSSSRLWIVVLPVLFFCFTAWMVLFFFDKVLLIQDAGAHMFQAKIFREGKLFAPAPVVPDAFSVAGDMLILNDGKWYTMYLPGFPLMLAAAMLVRFEWLLCPAMGAASLAIWIDYCRRWHDRLTALVVGVFFLFSPMLFLMYSNHMVHCAELFLASGVIYFCRRESEETSSRSLALLGIVLFLAILTRGFSLLPFVAPALAYTAWKRLPTKFARFAVTISVAVIASAIVIAAYQWKTTGDPMRAGYVLEYNPPLYYGFHGITLGQVHTPLRGLENTSNNLLGMNSWLMGWPIGSLFFLLLFVLKEKRIQPWDVVLFLCCGGLAVFYFFFVFQDLVRGPRYWFPMAPILLLFVARGILMENPRIRPYAISIAVASFAVFLAMNYPRYITRFSPVGTPAGSLASEIKNPPAKETLIFLDKHIPQQFVNWNDPFFRNGVVLSRDRGPQNAELIAALPQYKPTYFRKSQVLKKNVLTSGYTLANTPSSDPNGYLSLFDLALVIQSANSYTGEDLFDLCYVDTFAADSARDQLEYLNGLNSKQGNEPQRRQKLRAGLIHAARMVLLPKQAYEQNDDAWPRTFDYDAFRFEMRSAIDDFRETGDSAQSLLHQLAKIGHRIDLNDDGRFSDPEIMNFLTRKLRILQLK